MPDTITTKGHAAVRIVKLYDHIFVLLKNGRWWWSGNSRWKLDRFAYPDGVQHWTWQVELAFGLAKLGLVKTGLAQAYAAEWKEKAEARDREDDIKSLSKHAERLGFILIKKSESSAPKTL